MRGGPRRLWSVGLPGFLYVPKGSVLVAEKTFAASKKFSNIWQPNFRRTGLKRRLLHLVSPHSENNNYLRFILLIVSYV